MQATEAANGLSAWPCTKRAAQGGHALCGACAPATGGGWPGAHARPSAPHDLQAGSQQAMEPRVVRPQTKPAEALSC